MFVFHLSKLLPKKNFVPMKEQLTVPKKDLRNSDIVTQLKEGFFRFDFVFYFPGQSTNI